MKNYKILQTDFYQISMTFAYIVQGLETNNTGFEGFVRRIKPDVNPNTDFYIFKGETEIKDYMAIVAKELQDPELVETIIELVGPKLTGSNKAELIDVFRNRWSQLDKTFEYSVVPDNSIVFPLVPVFQFKGPNWIGSLIESYATNIYNGQTGLATIKYLKDNGKQNFVSTEEYKFLTNLINNDAKTLNEYRKILTDTAINFRDSTDKILLEAAFRRAPNKATADMASIVAIENKWNATSNVSVTLNGSVPLDKVGGTMAHSWVMSFKDEESAFKAWDKIFPGTAILIDTYDVEKAAYIVKKLIDAGEITPPKEVRIDSDPLDEYIPLVNSILGDSISAYVSGDMTVDKLQHFEFMNLHYSKAMVGTKYVYDSMIVEKLNCGFVYKVVQFESNVGDIIKPQKKATGKFNYSGLKLCIYDEVNNILTVDGTNPDNKIGFINFDNIKPTTQVKFI